MNILHVYLLFDLLFVLFTLVNFLIRVTDYFCQISEKYKNGIIDSECEQLK